MVIFLKHFVLFQIFGIAYKLHKKVTEIGDWSCLGYLEIVLTAVIATI